MRESLGIGDISMKFVLIFQFPEPPLQGECLPGARPARYLSINYPDFSPRFTL